MTDFRALCAELADALDNLNCNFNVPNQSGLVERARTALAEPETKEPTDADLHAMAFRFAQPCFDFEYIPFARAVLARWGQAS